MSLPDSRWHVVTESEFAWEREALEWLRQHIPDAEPWHVWTNFEFIDDYGNVSEVDALVIAPSTIYLIEIKSRPGVVGGDAHTWSWRTDSGERLLDNPLLLANRKAKRLASLLRAQPAITRGKHGLPRIEALVFLSDARVRCQLEGRARSGVVLRGRPGHPQDDGLIAAMQPGPDASPLHRIDRLHARAIARAIEEAGIRKSNRERQVGDYRLVKLLEDRDSYQDWVGMHRTVGVERRLRIFPLGRATSAEERDSRIRQAQREFTILQGIEHPGFLRCSEYKDSDLGPALIFDHDPRAVRLDHLIREVGVRLTLGQRLHLVRSIAETLSYAHRQRVHHRALTPRCVLVRDIESAEPRIQLMDWQTAARPTASTLATRMHGATVGTRHVDVYVDDPGLIYLAPELIGANAQNGVAADVFSLGCLAWLIFSGQPPAASSHELNERVRRGPGLRLSDVLNGCSSKMQELVQIATGPGPSDRYATIREFLEELHALEDELTQPDPEQTVDPGVAVANSRIDGGFTVLRKLGRGSSSDALLVRRDGSDVPCVLKVAIDPAHNDHLDAEAEALEKCRSEHIVALQGRVTVRGRRGLLLSSAGDATLAELLRRDGRPTLELLQRYGDQLLDAVRHLEDQAVVHRDIKPENIGIGTASNGRLRLVLFDFSLSRMPPDNIRAGTPPYLDPFLELRSHRRWDLYAERYAAAVTLYEMAVGKPPRWGDGQTAPQLTDAEASIEREALHPAVRDGLSAFFARALSRHCSARHDNAEDMLRAWRAAFEQPAPAAAAEDDFTRIARDARPQTTMAELGYSLEAQDILSRMGVVDVAGLLQVDRIRFRYLKGVGDRLRREIRLKAKQLAQLRPELTPAGIAGTVADDEAGADDTLPTTIDELTLALLPQKAGALDDTEQQALRVYLGLDASAGTGRWPGIGQTAAATGLERSLVSAALLKARSRWIKSVPALTEVRDEIARLLETQGQVLPVVEVVQALLVLRGSALRDDAERERRAAAVLRAALEAEAQLEQMRFETFDGGEAGDPLLLVTGPQWGNYAVRLGRAADAVAAEDPLLSPARALDALRAVARPDGPDEAGAPLADPRLLRLAAGASRRAALSSSQELYPRGLPAARALKAALDALIGPAELSARDIAARVSGRYPEAEPLPPHPALDELLAAAQAPLVWVPEAAHGRGAYRRPAELAGISSGSTTVFAPPTQGGRVPVVDPEDLAVRAVDERLRLNLRSGGLLLLTCPVRPARHAETRLIERYGQHADRPQGLRRVSLDGLLLDALRSAAKAMNARWEVVLAADGSGKEAHDWKNLNRLVQRALPDVRRRLLEADQPLLVVHAGLLARYDLLGLIGELEQEVGRPGRTPALWLLLPTANPGLPAIDGQPVPVVHANRLLPLDPRWIELDQSQEQPA